MPNKERHTSHDRTRRVLRAEAKRLRRIARRREGREAKSGYITAATMINDLAAKLPKA